MNQPRDIKFDNISMKNWILFLAFLVLGSYILYEFTKPFLAERHFREGYNLAALQRYKYAIEELELADKYAPWETHYQVQLGKSYEKYADKLKDDPDQRMLYLRKAETLYKRTISLDHQNPWYKNRMATIYAEMAKIVPRTSRKKYRDLAHDFNKDAAMVDLNNPLFQLNYAYFLHKEQRYDEALPYYVRTLEIDDRIIEAHYNIADIYRKQNKIDKTLASFIKIIKLKPKLANLNLSVASIYITKEKYKEAIPHLEQELIIQPKKEAALANLPTLYIRQNRFAEAIPLYEYLFRLYPANIVKYHEFLIQALVQTGKIDEAKSKLKSFIKLHPKNETAKSQLKKISTHLNKKR